MARFERKWMRLSNLEPVGNVGGSTGLKLAIRELMSLPSLQELPDETRGEWSEAVGGNGSLQDTHDRRLAPHLNAVPTLKETKEPRHGDPRAERARAERAKTKKADPPGRPVMLAAG